MAQLAGMVLTDSNQHYSDSALQKHCHVVALPCTHPASKTLLALWHSSQKSLCCRLQIGPVELPFQQQLVSVQILIQSPMLADRLSKGRMSN